MPVVLSCLPIPADGVTKQKITKLMANDKTPQNKQIKKPTPPPPTKPILLKNPEALFVVPLGKPGI